MVGTRRTLDFRQSTTGGVDARRPGSLVIGAVGLRHHHDEMLDTTNEGGTAPPDDEERRGCLFALSQPPLMIFLTVIGTLILLASLHDLLLL